MAKKKQIFFLSALFFAFVVLCNIDTLSFSPFGLRINNSESLSERVFLSVKATDCEIERGTVVSLKHHLFNVNIAKLVVGVAGDHIFVCDGHVYVNGDDVGELKERTSTGIPLVPVKTGYIDPGYLFVIGTHPQSFDSKYEEFGLVPRKNILEILWPIF